MRACRLRRHSRLAALLFASAPLPAFAAAPALSAWVAYLFFVIAATIVIVLLLHVALGDEPTEHPAHEGRGGQVFDSNSDAQLRFGTREGPDDVTNRGVA